MAQVQQTFATTKSSTEFKFNALKLKILQKKRNERKRIEALTMGACVTHTANSI